MEDTIKFDQLIKSIDKNLLLNKCKYYKIKIKGNENFTKLATMYLTNKSKLNFWDYPPDEFISYEALLIDLAIRYKLALKLKFNPKYIIPIRERIIKSLTNYNLCKKVDEYIDYFKNKKLL